MIFQGILRSDQGQQLETWKWKWKWLHHNRLHCIQLVYSTHIDLLLGTSRTSSNYNTIWSNYNIICSSYYSSWESTIGMDVGISCQRWLGPKDILQSTKWSFQKAARLHSAGEEAAVQSREQLIEHPGGAVALIQCDVCSMWPSVMGGAHSTAFMSLKVIEKSTHTPNTALLMRVAVSELAFCIVI